MASKYKLPIVVLSIGKQHIRCLIDTGSSTSIVKPNIFFLYKNQNQEKPIYIKTLNGYNEVKHCVVTPMPSQFLAKGTLSWKIVDFKSEDYDAIVGQNFLIPFKAEVNLDQMFLEVFGNKIYFEENTYPQVFERITSLQHIEIKDIQSKIKINDLSQKEQNSVRGLLNEFKDLFFVEGDKLSATTEICHEIITTTDKPLYSKIYRYPQAHEEEIQKQIKEMLDQNIIRESNSPYNSPLWIVPKKQDNSGIKKWRIVIDYRRLNENTINDKFPIPNLNGILDKLGRSQYFTTLDLAKGFHQILVKAEDQKKTAFSTSLGHYEFIRMPFGLKNAPSTFQRLMNSVFREQINKTCVIYMDDILVFSTSLEEHINSLRSIFNTLRKAKLKIQIDKCNFLKKETQFLGHVLTNKGIKPNPEKIRIIQNLKLPETTKQIKSFLGMTGFYRKFIKDYAKITSPLTKALRKDEKINTYDPNYILAFEKLKEIVTNVPILKYPIFTKKFKITTDASNFAIGAVLSQEGHPIAYASRTLNKTETNYSTIEKELLAIVWGVKYFRPYIYGKEFDLDCDHEPLKWLQVKYNGKDISPRLQRWLVQLGEYNIRVNYIKGKHNNVADFLSRINCDTNEINYLEENDVNKRNNNEEEESLLVQTIHSQEEESNDHVPILDTVVNRFKTQIILVGKKNNPIQEIFRKKRIFIDKSDFVEGNIVNILKREISNGKIAIFSELNDHEYNKLQKIIITEFSGNRKVKFIKCSRFAEDIVSENDLKKQIALFHKFETGHAGIIPTYEKIKHRIYNPKLKEFIQKVINNCEICSAAKYDRNPIKNKFQMTETPSTTNEIVHVDTYVNSKHSFVIFIDKFSKHVISFHLHDRNSQTLVGKIRAYLAIKGNVTKFVLDNEFNNANVKGYLDQEGIQYHFTKPNSHTGNSDIERFNNTITEKIRIFNLEEKLPINTQVIKAIKFYNNNYHSTIKCSPLDVQNKLIDHKVIKERLKNEKFKIIQKRNKSREDYAEHRKEGFIKNYKSVRHKEQPKFVKKPLENVHTNNIKRSFKFSDYPDFFNTVNDDIANTGNLANQSNY